MVLSRGVSDRLVGQQARQSCAESVSFGSLLSAVPPGRVGGCAGVGVRAGRRRVRTGGIQNN
ncbi:MAG: hypothetical protein J07HX64_01530 [halophilic archaeon J07HX64]|nr:MAG: hypothetical protein J07HX64_01530 [halophilic archaeon J07HX64]